MEVLTFNGLPYVQHHLIRGHSKYAESQNTFWDDTKYAESQNTFWDDTRGGTKRVLGLRIP